MDDIVYEEAPAVTLVDFMDQAIDELDGAALADLAETLRAKADERIQAEREADLVMLNDLAAKLGATVTWPKPAKSRRKAAKKAERQPTGTVLPAKCVDPATGQGWSGRGRQPAWLRDYVGAGRRPSEFAVS